MTEAEFDTLKQLYESVADENSASYKVFLKKLKRLQEGNVRTTNRVSRELGVTKPKPRSTTDFLAYDGEGWSDKYVLLANSLGERIVEKEGLSTVQCLAFLSQRYSKAYKRIFFSFGYDVNHIIKDIPDDQLLLLIKGQSITYEGYRISYVPGKMFIVNGYRYYDVFSFFARSFVKVVAMMLGPERVSKELVEGKNDRSIFDTWDIDKIIKYNDEELQLMIEVMDKLREAFQKIGVNLTQWYGPGAVAKYWFNEHGIVPKEKHTIYDIAALNSAYYGGRFEQLVLGKVKNVYEYDIHSAYPSVMVDMPHFVSWQRSSQREFTGNESKYSIWHLTFDLRESWYPEHLIRMYNNSPYVPQFGPLPVRSKDGRICYPLMGKGWYWYDEVKVMLDFFPTAVVKVHDGYVAHTEGKPFEWIKELYDYRMQLKDAEDLSQYAIKVGLNSLYGKCAQRVGKNPYFSLAWAGYITAETRAKLARAGYEAGSEHILGFATDAIFSDKKLSLTCSDDLGSWEQSSYHSGTFFQSGVYRLTREDGTISDRYRGSPLRRGIDDIISQLQRYPRRYPRVKIARFISNLLAITAPSAYGPYRNKFVQVVYELKIDAPYKRHYEGLDGNFKKLLTQRIDSSIKAFSGDNNGLLSEFYIQDRLVPKDVESVPPPMRDQNTIRLLDEANLLGWEEGPDTVDEVEVLPVVEDEME